MTAWPAPPTSDRASERGAAPPVHRWRREPRRGRPAARPSGPAWPAGSPAQMRAATRPAARQGRLLAVPAGPGRHPGQSRQRSSPRVGRRCRLPLSRAGRNSRTATCTTLTRSRPPPPSSPPYLTRGHSPQELALRASPVNEDAERKKPLLLRTLGAGRACDQ